MKIFAKLVLVSSIAASANVMALQAMDDKALSSSTGQQGLTITVDTTSGIEIGKIFVHDEDGFKSQTLDYGTATVNTTGTATEEQIKAGAITVNGLKLTKAVGNTAELAKMTIDSASVNNKAVLNVLSETGAMKVEIGSIGVGKSGDYDAATNTRGIAENSEKTIISNLSLELGATKANIQLGNAPQGAMIVVASEIVGGIKTSLTLNDSSENGGGVIGITDLKVTSQGSANLNADAKIGIDTGGIYIKPASTAINTYIGSLSLGEASKKIGAVEIQGMNMGATTIKISGH